MNSISIGLNYLLKHVLVILCPMQAVIGGIAAQEAMKVRDFIFE